MKMFTLKGPRDGPRTTHWHPGVLVSSGGFRGGRGKEVTAHVWKCSPRSSVSLSHTHSGSAPPPCGRVSPARADRKSPPGDPTVTARHGSGQNTSPNDGGDHRQVQQEPVHGGPLRTTPGEFGSAGNEVRCLGAGRGACTCCAACCSRFIFLHNGAAWLIARNVMGSTTCGSKYRKAGIYLFSLYD